MILCFVSLLTSCMVDEIKENKAVTSAKIIGSRKDYRNWAFSLNYTYKIDSNLYVRKSSHTVSGKYLKDYMYKYFPVVYSTKNPGKSILLVTPADFKRWGIQFPDSLNWVRDKIGF